MYSLFFGDLRRQLGFTVRPLLLFSLALCATAAMAQFAKKKPGPLEERGFAASGSFQESVNVMSGSVNIAIPLATLESSNDFVFQLSLFYDANVWDVGPGDPEFRTSDLRFRPSDTFDGLDPSAGAYAWNVSPGWLVHPGRIVAADPDQADGAHFIYLAPDHSKIPLYQTLRGGDAVQANTYYSRDGRFLKFVSDNGATGTLYDPNGVRTRFLEGWFADVADAYGNTVVKTMIFPEDNLQEVIMVFRENRFNREIRVGLTPTHTDIFCATPCFNPDMGLVEWVDYPAPGVDEQGNPARARIVFGRMPVDTLLETPIECNPEDPAFDPVVCQEWHDLNQNLLLRPDFCNLENPNFNQLQCSRWEMDNNVSRWTWRRHLAEIPPIPGCPAVFDCIGNFDDLTLYAGGAVNTYKPPLNRLTFPDGTEYRFNYGYISEVDGGPPGMLSGALSEMILPTGAAITYTYGEFRLPDNRRDDLRYGDEFDDKNFWAPQMGVISKKYFGVGKDFSTDTPDEVTLYRRGYVDANNMNDANYLNQSVVVHSDEASRQREMFVVVTSPLGHETVHFYRTPEKAWDYGLPFTRHSSLSNAFPSRGQGDIRQAYLSQEVFNGPAVVNGVKGDLKRQHYLAYERDAKHANEDFTSQLNARVHYTREVFHDDLDANDQPHFKEQLLSNYDGYGNYRTMTNNGSFGGFGGRIQTTNFNPGTGSYVVFESTAGGDSSETFKTGNGHTFTARSATAPWVLVNYDYLSRISDGQESRDEYHFDENTGKLLRKRVLANFYNSSLTPRQNRSTNDIIYLQTYDTRGTLTLTRQYGGDVQSNLNLGTLATLAMPANPEYRTGHVPNYNTGVFASYVQDPVSGDNLMLLQRSEVDEHTGLVIVEVAADGVETATEYNVMLLENQKNIGSDDPILVNYTYNNGVHGSIVERTQGTAKTWVYLDGLGRTTRSEENFPGNKRSKQVMDFENGVMVRKSNPYFTAANRTDTVYSQFDFLGRPTHILFADGKTQTIEYRGDRLIRYQDEVATNINGTETQATKTETFDPLGRLISIHQSIGNAQNLVTRYSYNVQDILSEVQVGDGATAQIRTFTYDNRGFLLEESHPELVSAADVADVSYGLYDSAGKPGEMITPDLTLRYSYHSSGQLSRIREVLAGGGQRTLKDFFYSTSNLSAHNRTAGKLVQSRRFNYLPGVNEPVVVTKTFSYREHNGRLSTVRLRTDTGQQFEQSFTYDSLGNIDHWHYPAKKITGVDQALLSELFGGETQRTIDHNYTRGMLTSIPGLVTAIAYHPHQAFHAEITHANGIKDQVEISDGMVRPFRIKARQGNQNIWNTGVYNYDGAGNIKAIGGSNFRLDLASRLLEADILSGGNRFNQAFDYDEFGNITTFDGQAMNVDPATNRFSSSASYDARGNLTQFGTSSYTYDAMGMVTRFSDGSVTERYLYDADDRRLATLKPSGAERWTVRDEEGLVVKEYDRNNSDQNLRKVREYVYGGRLLGAYYSEPAQGGGSTVETRHYHLDHLGNLRMITDPTGAVVSEHDYYAYGQEISPNQGDQKQEFHKFTGQERDAADRDYFKARYYQPMEGRFLSPDPVDGNQKQPQSWNRYAYGNNNPLRYTDPSGETAFLTIPFEILSKFFFFDEIEVVSTPIEIEPPPIDGFSLLEQALNSEVFGPRLSRFNPKRHRLLSQAEVERRIFQQVTGMGIDHRRDFLIGLGSMGQVQPFLAPNTTGPYVRHDLAPGFQAGQLIPNLTLGLTRSGQRATAMSPGPGANISGRNLRTHADIVKEQGTRQTGTLRVPAVIKNPRKPPVRSGITASVKGFYKKHETLIKGVAAFAAGYLAGRALTNRIPF